MNTVVNPQVLPNPQPLSHAPVRSGLYTSTYFILPSIFALHFVSTGTVVLIYTLYLQEPIPSGYSIGVTVVFAILIVSIAAGHTGLWCRRRYGVRSQNEVQSPVTKDVWQAIGAWARMPWKQHQDEPQRKNIATAIGGESGDTLDKFDAMAQEKEIGASKMRVVTGALVYETPEDLRQSCEIDSVSREVSPISDCGVEKRSGFSAARQHFAHEQIDHTGKLVTSLEVEASSDGKTRQYDSFHTNYDQSTTQNDGLKDKSKAGMLLQSNSTPCKDFPIASAGSSLTDGPPEMLTTIRSANRTRDRVRGRSRPLNYSTSGVSSFGYIHKPKEDLKTQSNLHYAGPKASDTRHTKGSIKQTFHNQAKPGDNQINSEDNDNIQISSPFHSHGTKPPTISHPGLSIALHDATPLIGHKMQILSKKESNDSKAEYKPYRAPQVTQEQSSHSANEKKPSIPEPRIENLNGRKAALDISKVGPCPQHPPLPGQQEYISKFPGDTGFLGKFIE